MVFEAYDKNPLLSSRYTKKGFEVKRGINYYTCRQEKKIRKIWYSCDLRNKDNQYLHMSCTVNAFIYFQGRVHFIKNFLFQ